jgi:hypothetical protein
MRPTARFLGSTLALLALTSIAAPPARSQACDAAPRVRLEFGGIQAAVGVTVHAFVSAHDPNGTAIASLTFDGTPLPAGHDAALVPNASNTAGEFTWTPQPGEAGIYHVPILASNSLTGSASLQITVVDTEGAPFVTAPDFVQAVEGSFVTFEVYAGDPDGTPIDALTADIPLGATFTPNASNTQGTFAWDTGFGSGGSWPVSFTATNDLAWTTSTTINVVLSDRPPVITVPGTVVGTEGVPLTICAEAFDADGDPLDVFTVSPQLPGVQIVPSPTNEVLEFSWTPQPGQAGSYLLSFFAANEDGSVTQNVSLTILPASDRPPVVGAPAAVSGTEGNPLAVNVTASDPDGDAIASLTASPLVPGMAFAANGTNTAGTLSWTPSVGEAGTYFVVFTAANTLTGSATTQITVARELFTTVAFTVGGDKTLRLGSGKPRWCLYLEPVNNAYSLSDIDLSTVVLRSPGTGSVEEIHAITGKSSVAGDRNMNDVPDLEICFAKEDLRALFSGLSGRQLVDAAVEGDLIGGGRFRGELVVDVVAGGALAASLRPNPPGPLGTLEFTTAVAGRVRVRVFDLQGRLVRSLADAPALAPGRHTLPVDGRTDRGDALPSGIYYYRIETPEGSASGRFAWVR